MPKRKLPEGEKNKENLEIGWIPKAAEKFYEKYPELVKSLQFVGPFRVLNGEIKKSRDNLEIAFLDRFATDLPEMQTFLLTEKGRYCFWRDFPNQADPLIVFAVNSPATFPDIKIVGNRIEHAIHHGKLAKSLEDDAKSLEKEMRQCRDARIRAKMGETSHEPGIWVKMKGNVGYRCLFHSAKKLRVTLEKIAKSQEIDENSQKILDEEFRHLQIANDEMDFGMGLELGHLLFLANSEKVKSMMMFSMKMAYTFLKRKEFWQILEETLKIRETL
ncbi:unnamed protein product [Caenorhabditis angaria]|uniref:Uncharacterized protein n=1 Tax=Caenorhabditis angaria TaxID=860376 RepID=A0A9P1IL43_9PELO|nr:unnamed protein product [Caenorhabditis angaria]